MDAQLMRARRACDQTANAGSLCVCFSCGWLRTCEQHHSFTAAASVWHAAFVIMWSATVKLPVAIKQVLSASRVVDDYFNSCRQIE